MTTLVLLDLGCCPAGSTPERTVRERGGKAVVLDARTDPAPAEPGWAWRTALVVGLAADVVAAGCPVPLAPELTGWAAVADEVGADRWDAVVLRLPAERVADWLEAPARLLGVLDHRLDRLAAGVGEEPRVGEQVAELLAWRPDLQALVALAARAVAVGGAHAHAAHACPRPGTLAVAGVDLADHAGPVSVPVTGVERDGGDLLWWLALPVPAAAVGREPEPELWREGDDLLVVRVGEQVRRLPLPAALVRCRAVAAVVVDDRLQVRFRPDPDAWR